MTAFTINRLTARQAQTLEYVRSYAEEHGYSPSLREVAKELGITPNGAQEKLKALEAKGAIARTPGVARSLRICKPMA